MAPAHNARNTYFCLYTKRLPILKLKKTFSAWLSTRYQLVVRNEEDLEERSTFSFSHAKLIALCTLLLLILVACSIVLSTTVLAKWLNPAYIDHENRRELAKLNEAVKDFEQQTMQQKKFITLLQSVIAGKEPPTVVASPNNEEQHVDRNDYTPAQQKEADDSLRREFEGDDFTLLPLASKSLVDLTEATFFPPVNGIITMPFKRSTGHYGIDIVAKEKAPIQCIADGMVIFSDWTAEAGWVIMIQHSKDLVSVYKHNAALFQKVGSFVKAGDVIAIMGSSGKLSTGPHLHFELWQEGNPINPEYFIAL